MQNLKLAVSLAGVLMAGQALAHKASRTMVTPSAAARLAPAQTDTSPAALLGGIAGRGTPGITAMPVPALQLAPSKNGVTGSHITHRH